MLSHKGALNTGLEQQQEQKTKILARVYAEILSWPDPRKKNDDSAFDGASGETDAASVPCESACVGSNLATQVEQPDCGEGINGEKEDLP